MRPHAAARPPSSPARLALAGLLLFAAPLAAEDVPPGRSIAPAPVAAPAVSKEDFEALGGRVDALASDLAKGLDQLGRRLDGAVSAAGDQAEALKAAQGEAARLGAALKGQGAALEALTARAAALEAAMARDDSAAAARDRRADGLAAELATLRGQAETDRDAAKDALKRLQAAQADLDGRSRKLESLTDLLGVMKKDLDANNEELVEVKQALKRLEAAMPAAASPQTAWWDSVLGWRYLPAVAVGLSAVALGFAAAH